MKFTVSFLLAFLFAATAYSQDKLRTLLPTRIYAATGLETNIYFDNVVLTPNCSNYIFDVTCSKGRQDSARWYMNPKDTDIGSVPFELTILNDENKKLASAKSEIVIVSKDAGKGRAFSILVVGDSLTDASVYPNELKKLLAENGNPDVTFIGSHSGRGQAVNGNRVSHEGRGGWKWSDFCTVYDLSKSDYKSKSPFLFPDEKGKPVLDFKKYLDKYNNGKAPDFITVFLGTNDVFGVNDDASIDKKIDEIFKYADILIAEFRKTAPLRHQQEFPEREIVRVYSTDSGGFGDKPVNRSSSDTRRSSNEPSCSMVSIRFRAIWAKRRVADRIFLKASRFASGKKSITSSRRAEVARSMASPAMAAPKSSSVTFFLSHSGLHTA